MHRLQEPGDVESPRQVAQASAPSKQHKAPIPHRLQFGAVHYFRLAFERILDQRAVVSNFCKDEEPSVSVTGNGRKRSLSQMPPITGETTCLQSAGFGVAQYVGDADCLSG